MAHPLVAQLRFTRSEFVRGLMGLSDADARQRLDPMNCISWIIGHLAWQEQRYWLLRAQGRLLLPDLNERVAYGRPATTPALEEMWAAWRTVTDAADPWLDGLTTAALQRPLADGLSSVGTFLRRTTYHYWYHLGEALAVRQVLGHRELPDFVGDIDAQAPYEPE
jgi:DinB superfamily